MKGHSFGENGFLKRGQLICFHSNRRLHKQICGLPLVHHYSAAHGRKVLQNIGEKAERKSFYISGCSRCVLINNLPLVWDFQNNQLWHIYNCERTRKKKKKNHKANCVINMDMRVKSCHFPFKRILYTSTYKK